MMPLSFSAKCRVLLAGATIVAWAAFGCSKGQEIEGPDDDGGGTPVYSGGGGNGGAGSGGTGGARTGGATSTGGTTISGGGTSAGGAPTGGVSASGGSTTGGAGGTGGAPTGGAGGVTTGGAPTGGAGGAPTGGAGGAPTGGTAGAGGATGGTGGVPPPSFVYKSIPDSKCRDGSTAGYFIKEGAPSKNLMIFLDGGGGVCFDSFLCGIAPQNVNESVDGETAITLVKKQTPQKPPVEGIFKNDTRNPVHDWNMVYVPYCTGDVHAGTKKNGMIPGVSQPQQFVGYTNFGLFLDDFGSKFQDADKVLLAGASGGSYGALINADRTMPKFPGSTLYVLSDSGVPFDDQYLEPCLQKTWRDLWGLNGAMPVDCPGCFQPDGGGIAKGLSAYLYNKYKGRLLGGFVSSNQDDVVKAFYTKGLNNCASSPFYPADRFPNGLHNVRDVLTDKARTSSYFINGINHVHTYRTRFYDTNGLSMSLASWLDKTLQGQSVHQGD
jgi:hypothetical protein